MQKESIKFQESLIFEGMTSLRAVIRAIDGRLSDRRILEVYFDKGRMGNIAKDVGYLRAVSGKYGFTLVESDAEKIDEMTLGSSHGGIVARVSERTVPHLSAEKISPIGFYVMLQGIEDPYNFGYALRSLYAMGCDGVVLDERNWLSAAGVVARSSAGASELLPFFTAPATDAVDVFHDAGYSVVMADLRTENELGNTPLPYPVFLVVGGEKRGLSASLLEKADTLVKIPYAREFGASLSAASATTMFAYEIMRQRINKF